MASNYPCARISKATHGIASVTLESVVSNLQKAREGRNFLRVPASRAIRLAVLEKRVLKALKLHRKYVGI